MWLSRLVAWFRTPVPNGAVGSFPLVLERLEDRRMLDAAAALVAGELLITGDDGGSITDSVTLHVTEDGFGGQFLEVLDHGNPLAIDLGGGNSATQIELTDLTAGRIQIDLGLGDDQLNLQLPHAAGLPSGLEIVVQDGAGHDSVTFENARSILPGAHVHVSIVTDRINFAPGFGTNLDDVDFDLTGPIELGSDLNLQTGGGDFLLHGEVSSPLHNDLHIDVGAGDLTVDGLLGSPADPLGDVALSAQGNIEVDEIRATENILLAGDEIHLHHDLRGENLQLMGTTYVHDPLEFHARGDLDLSNAALRPLRDNLNLNFTAGADLELGAIEKFDPGMGFLAFQQVQGNAAFISLQGPIHVADQIEFSAVAIDVASSIASDNGLLGLFAVNDLHLLSGALLHTNGGAIQLIADADNVCDGLSGALIMEDGSQVVSNSGAIQLSADESITLASVMTGRALPDALSVTSKHGAIVDGGDLHIDLVANSPGAVITLTAADGIGSGNALELQAAAIDMRNLMGGDIQIVELDDVDIIQATQSGPGILDLHSLGSLTLLNTVAGPQVSTTTGDVVLSADVNMTLAGQVHSDAGSVLIQSGQEMLISATGEITGTAAVTLEAGASLTMEDGAEIISSGDRIHLTAAGDITLGHVAGTQLIEVTSLHGGIVDGGDTGGADLAATVIAFHAATGIGSDNSLETSTTTLAAENLMSGSIWLNNDSGTEAPLMIGAVNGLVGITNLAFDDGEIIVTNLGSISVTEPVLDVAGGGMTLTALGAESDLFLQAPVYAALSGGIVHLNADRDIVLEDTGLPDDVRGQEIIGIAGRDIVFDEHSGVTVRSATGTVISPTPLIENLRTPQIGSNGISDITVDFGHVGSSNFYFLVLWDPAFVDRFDAAPASFDGAPIFGLNNSRLPAGVGPQNLPPTFATALQVLIDRSAEVGSPESFDGYDPIALTKLGRAAYLGDSTLVAAHFYGANPDKSAPYNPAADIPIAVHIWDDGNITFMAAGQDLGQADISGRAGVPGEGLQGAFFVFDLSIEVPPLEAPRVIIADTATLAPPLVQQTSDTDEAPVLIEAEVVQVEQILIIERIRPDGTVARLPNGTPIRSERMGEEVRSILSNLPELFNRLRDGHWRIYVKQGADGQPQLIQDVELHEGKPAGNDAGTQDRQPE